MHFPRSAASNNLCSFLRKRYLNVSNNRAPNGELTRRRVNSSFRLHPSSLHFSSRPTSCAVRTAEGQSGRKASSRPNYFPRSDREPNNRRKQYQDYQPRSLFAGRHIEAFRRARSADHRQRQERRPFRFAWVAPIISDSKRKQHQRGSGRFRSKYPLVKNEPAKYQTKQ
jgi:hypothetical protein